MKKSSNTADGKPLAADGGLDLPNTAPPPRRPATMKEIIAASEQRLPFENRRRGLSRGHFLGTFELD